MCPRSSSEQKKLRVGFKPISRGRLFWTKGPMLVKAGRWRMPVAMHNPGVPYVKPPKPWYAGGLPGRGGPDNMKETVSDFVKQLRDVVGAAQA
ncbi:hypothetical protein LCGC14_0651650 [marine sediment metagenome]|uniref:Uncharacterized protein n=1 Tax=marine sediment metagenome TaxID=412755 RepID=A0A0F9U4L0_9ZZZZ